MSYRDVQFRVHQQGRETAEMQVAITQADSTGRYLWTMAMVAGGAFEITISLRRRPIGKACCHKALTPIRGMLTTSPRRCGTGLGYTLHP